MVYTAGLREGFLVPEFETLCEEHTLWSLAEWM